jgi:hypothetical protein
MYKWQLDLLDKMTKYKGRGFVMTTGRQLGKSAFSAQAWQRMMDDIYNRPVEDLILTESKVHGARYYCVEPVGGNWLEMEKWSVKTYGDPGEIWPMKTQDDFGWPECNRWYMNNRKFWFRNEADRTMFVMKWR